MQRVKVIFVISLMSTASSWADDYGSFSYEDRPSVMLKAARPLLGIELSGGSITAGVTSLIPVGIRVDLQPYRGFGTLAIGVDLEYSLVSDVTPNASVSLKNAWSVGGHAQYQFRFTPRQIVVPTISYRGGLWGYGASSNVLGSFFTHGPAAGLNLDLGLIDRVRQSSLFQETGIKRTFLFGEVGLLAGGDAVVTLNTRTVRAGLRFEI